MLIRKVLFVSGTIVMALLEGNGYAQNLPVGKTSKLQKCLYEESTKKFSKCTGATDTSTFDFSNDSTIFNRTTSYNYTYHYTVGKKTLDKDSNYWIYDMKDAYGEKYLLILDLEHKHINLMYVHHGEQELDIYETD